MAFNFSLLSLIVFKLSIFNGIEWYQAEPPSSHTQQHQYNTIYHLQSVSMHIECSYMQSSCSHIDRITTGKICINESSTGIIDLWKQNMFQGAWMWMWMDETRLLFNLTNVICCSSFFHFFHWVFKKSIWNFSQRK